MKVNIFNGMNAEIVEECINEWIEANPNIYLWKVTQSESVGPYAWSLTISIWYQEEAANESTQAD